MVDGLATSLGFDELDDTAAIVFREGDGLHSFVGDYGPTDEHFRKVARSTVFDFDGDKIIVEGDFNGHVVFRRMDDYKNICMITWARLVDECEPVADGWINMPEKTMSNIVYVYDTNNNRHIMSAQSVSEHDIENGFVVLDDDHKCPECHEYIKGDRVDYGG